MVPEARAGPAEGRQGGRRLLGREAWLLMQPLKFCASSVNGERVTRNPLSISQKAREKAAVFVESDRFEKVEVYCWAALSLVRGSRKRSPLRALRSSSGKGESGFETVQDKRGAPVFQALLGLHDVHQRVSVVVQVLEEDLVAEVVVVVGVAGRREQHEAPQPAQHGPAGAGPRRRVSQAASPSGPSESVPPAAAPPAAFSTPRSRRAAGPRSQRECGGGWTRAAAVPSSLRRGAPRLWLSGGARGASEGPPRGRPWPRRYAGVGPPGSWKLRLQTRRPRPFQPTVDSGAEGSLRRGAPTPASRERSGVEDLTGQTQRACGSS
ncbi:uncharacterized protein LOC111179892 [Delphinapterus leucas]|uniref:Uncharacterized protein LOC111179892 n=1 Tax=Delphinapterus leucas TaxID=9749 RepID=A0A7F8K390_DELLE|nr:uncharacterized protein LOC111179892 [Delphinapterus leucas]